MLISDLPQELVDNIIAQLRGDAQSLAGASLVCRSWRWAAQREIFHSIHVAIGSPWTLADFITFLSSLSVDAPQRQIQHLTIRSAKRGSAQGVLDGPISHDATAQDVLDVLKYLPSIKSYTVQRFKLVNLENCTPNGTSIHLGRLTLVHVVLCTGNPDSFARFVSHSGSASLALYDVLFGQNHAGAPEASETVPHIRSLTMRTRGRAGLYLDIFGRGDLDELKVACFSFQDAQEVGSFLSSSPHLTHLGLSLNDAIVRAPLATDQEISVLHLGQCHTLTSLNLRIALQCTPWSSLPFNSTVFRAASRVFATAPLSLPSVTFTVVLDGQSKSETAFLGPFAERLDNEFAWLKTVDEQRPQLREIKWVWYGQELAKEGNPGTAQRMSAAQLKGLIASLTAMVRAKFVRLDEKGILVFVLGDETSA